MSKKAKISDQTTEASDVKTTQISNAKEKSSKKINNKKTDKKKEKRTKKLSRTIKETSSELKKVTWPSFKEVAKKTGVVLTVVLVFAVVLLGVDYLLGLLFGLLN